MLSAEQDVRTKVAGFDAGAVDYITKPFHRAEVMARVRTQLRLHAAHRAAIELQALKLAQLASAQQAMIPQPEKMPAAGFRLYYRPLQEAGGDFCHVCAVGGSLHDYIVGDVCGHHVGTAMHPRSAPGAPAAELLGPLLSGRNPDHRQPGGALDVH